MFYKTHRNILDLLQKLGKDVDLTGIFASPVIYVLLKTFAKNQWISLTDYRFDNDVEGFLRKMNFYNDHFKILAENILPISTITAQDTTEIEETTNKFEELIKHFIGEEKENLTKNMGKMIGEMLNNIDNHSGEVDITNPSQVHIFANYQSGQFYKKSNCIQIVVADAGVGILSSVRKKEPSIQNAQDAIKKALEAGFTGGTRLQNSSHSNAWIGLTSTLETIKKLGGDMFIGTRDCLFSYNGESKMENFEKIPIWKWTFIVLNIYTNTNVTVNFADIKDSLLKNGENFDFDRIFW